MTKKKNLSVFPEYDEKNGMFLGYAVKRGSSFLKDQNGKKIILSVQTDPKGLFVSYQGEKWNIHEKEYEIATEAQLKFKAKVQNGHFQGYTILQYDEKENKLMPRGTIGAQDIKYKRAENGSVDCFYEDMQADGSCKTYFISQMTQEEYDLLQYFS